MGGKIRRLIFWLLDFLKGSPVRLHLKNIEYMMENYQNEITDEYMNLYLNNILIHASETSKFYFPYRNQSLENYPIINKNIIKENYEHFISSEYNNKKNHNLSTSGSTGVPLVIKQDQNKRNRVYAEMMYFWNKAGYKFGDKYVFFRVWNNINKKSKFVTFSRNLIMWNISELDKENLLLIKNMLIEDVKIKMIIAYASTLEVLANYLLSENIKINSVNTIISGSEVLSDLTREKLKKVFDCNIVSLYSNQENGMLAQECVEHNEFHVNHASYFIEVLKIDNDQPAEVGELGRIVVTDLFNYAMPLIRYDTGDLVRKKKSSACGWRTNTWNNIEGREVDMIYSTSGKPLSPHAINNNMWQFNKLKQWQFIQVSSCDYILKVNDPEKIYSKVSLIDNLKKIIGHDANIFIEYVEGIPNLRSGKFKKTICNFKPDEIKEEK